MHYREWYGADRSDKGLKLTTEEVARGILERDAGDKITYSVADPAIFAEDGGPSRAEVFTLAGVHFNPADNRRVAGAGAIGGWDEMRQRLRGKDGRADACGIRDMHSPSSGPCRCCRMTRSGPRTSTPTPNDHVADEARYACMSRPWVPQKPVPERKGDGSGYSEKEREDYSLKSL